MLYFKYAVHGTFTCIIYKSTSNIAIVVVFRCYYDVFRLKYNIVAIMDSNISKVTNYGLLLGPIYYLLGMLGE